MKKIILTLALASCLVSAPVIQCGLFQTIKTTLSTSRALQLTAALGIIGLVLVIQKFLKKPDNYCSNFQNCAASHKHNDDASCPSGKLCSFTQHYHYPQTTGN